MGLLCVAAVVWLRTARRPGGCCGGCCPTVKDDILPFVDIFFFEPPVVVVPAPPFPFPPEPPCGIVVEVEGRQRPASEVRMPLLPVWGGGGGGAPYILTCYFG